jgi:prepilin peptidase CpaA
MLNHLGEFNFGDHWHVWIVTATLILAATIDGIQLKVPNWITFPMILTGWGFNLATGGWAGLGWSLVGTAVGLGLLIWLYAIGGMGAGDVKLFAGVGAWMLPEATLIAFCWAAIIGGVIAVAMALACREWRRHQTQFLMILTEIATIGNPAELSAIAAERKSSMRLLPYGIPLAIGSIAYFAWAGML